ncbi:MAG: hypothetical protein U0838_05045 [Chloroflexota bacterium]
MRLRLLAPTAALASCSLAAQPAAAGGPPPPPTGQWTQVGSTPYPPIIAGTVWGGKMGPDGKLYVYGSFQNAGGDDTADNLAVYSPATRGVVPYRQQQHWRWRVGSIVCGVVGTTASCTRRAGSRAQAASLAPTTSPAGTARRGCAGAGRQR